MNLNFQNMSLKHVNSWQQKWECSLVNGEFILSALLLQVAQNSFWENKKYKNLSLKYEGLLKLCNIFVYSVV